MPTIPQLPSTHSVSPSDVIPISQGGSVHAASLGTLLLSAQPVITVQSPSLIGRTSLGSGGPEQIDVGIGMSLSGGTVAANGADHATYPSTSSLSLEADLVVSNQGSPMLMPTELLRGLFTAGSNVTIDGNGIISATGSLTTSQATLLGTAIGALQVVSAVTAHDLVPLSQLGTTHAIAYQDLLNGLTIDQAPSAAPTSDSDTTWVAQATNVMGSQSFGAIWTWISGKIPTYRVPVIEVIANTNLDVVLHNGRVLICSQPITISPVAANMGNGFQCQVINVSTGSVTLGTGFLTSSNNLTVGPRQTATIQCFTYSAGTIAYASISQASTIVVLPGQVSQLAASNITTTTITCVWQQPISGSTPMSYSVQYRQTGSTAWIVSSVSVSTTSFQLSNLQSNTSYDIQVTAANGGGTGAASQTLTVSTTATATQAAPPGQVSGLAAVAMSTSSIQLSWSAQSGANTATSYTVQYRISGSSTWTSSISGISVTNNSITGLSASTSYDFSAFGVNANGAGSASTIVSAATPAVGTSVSLITWNVTPSGTYTQSSGSVGVNAHVSPSSAAVQFGFSTSVTTPPISWTAGLHINTDLWGAYVSTPPSSGSWYAWVEGTDGSSPTVFTTPFTVQ